MTASFRDSRGALCVDCTECVRGYNGDQSCSAGWRHKRAKVGSCFAGELLPGVVVP